MNRLMARYLAAMMVALCLALAGCGVDEATSTEQSPAAPDAASTEEEGTTAQSTVEGTAAQSTVEGTAVENTKLPETATELPIIVVTTNVLGDVVRKVMGDAAEIITIMPVNADPHDFQASAQQIDQLLRSDALIVNGGSYEEGLLDVIEIATQEGVPTFEALTAVQTIEYGEGGHDDEHGDEHDDKHDDEHDDKHGDEHDDEHDGHGHHSGEDPHFFTDPMRMAEAVEGLVTFLQNTVEFADPDAVNASADAYLAQLRALDIDVAEMVAGLPEAKRVLVTNHQVFGYFADRYGFEVIGAVVPSGTTLETTSGGELDALAQQLEAEGVRAVFSDTSASDKLIQALADEVGDVEVVALFTESLGDPDSDGGTYLDMVRSNAERIVDALK